ncbi:Transposase (plasmid) [Lactococcus lactis subsp. lactis bv. diacetylactis]|nr:Transposase [Lactococcus lactis subsp. lactis bv. diacetylactis]
MADTKWAYVSAITDEASKEVLAFQVSNSPNGSVAKFKNQIQGL